MRLRAWLNDYVRKYLLKVNNIDTGTKFTGAGSVSLLLTLSRYSPTWNDHSEKLLILKYLRQI